MDASTLIAWVGAILSGIATLIFVPLGFYGARYYWDYWRWQRFNALIRTWTQEELFPEDMTEDDWHILVAMKLVAAGFEPARVKELIDVAIWFAKGQARQELRGQIAQGVKEIENGPPDSEQL